MMFEDEIGRLARSLRSEAEIDFFDLSLIAEPLRERLALMGQQEIRHHTLRVVRKLMEMDVYPGDYDYALTMKFWLGEQDELIKRIEAEWVTLGHTPTLAQPICWFGLRNSEIS